MTARQASRFGSGNSVKRVEDDALLRGKGRFVDNLPAAGQLYACFVRSPHPHARIARIDVGAAAAMPGVARVLTGRDLVNAGVRPIPNSTDFKRSDGARTATPQRHALAVDTVRFVGEAVVAVIAATPLEARDAAEAVQIDYEPLPAVVDIVAATAAGAPAVVPEAPDNIACEARHGDPAAAAAAFAAREARRCARSRQPARRALRDRAALDARHLRRSERASDAARELPDSDGIPRRVVRRDSEHPQGERAGHRRRRRRRLRDEDRRLSGGRGRRVRRARVETAGPLHRRADRGVPRGEPRPRRASARPSSRSTATDASWRCASLRSRT